MKFSVDSLIIRDNRVFAYGWLFDPDQAVEHVALRASLLDGSHALMPVVYGKRRADVKTAFPMHKHSANSGWMVYAGWLGASAQAISVVGRLADGSPFEIGLPFKDSDGAAIKRPGLLASMRSLFRRKAAIPKQQNASPASLLDPQQTLELVRHLLAEAGEARCALVFDHEMGGGANHFRSDWVKAQLLSRPFVLIVTFEITSLRLVLSVATVSGTQRNLLLGPTCIEALAKSGAIDHVLYNDAVSFARPADVPGWLIQFKSIPDTKLAMAVHDYFSVCPSQFLLDDRQRFCRVPDMQECLRCLPGNDNEFSTLFTERYMPRWREVWGNALLVADEVLCFSNSSRELLLRAYPSLPQSRMSIIPHKTVRFDRTPVLELTAPLHLGVIGAIGFHKGAGVIQSLAAEIARRGVPVKISIIGTIELPCEPSVVDVSGPYERTELPRRIEASLANLFLLPSICPETFSYATQELMDLQVPLACFDFGAPAERVAKYEFGRVMPLRSAAEILDDLICFHSEIALSRRPRPQ